MNKIYGYDDKLMIKLIDFIKNRQGENLTTLFKEFSVLTGKSGGTIRNLYYAIAKKAEQDDDFKNTYLKGTVTGYNSNWSIVTTGYGTFKGLGTTTLSVSSTSSFSNTMTVNANANLYGTVTGYNNNWGISSTLPALIMASKL